MVGAYQGDELPTTINEAGLDPSFVSMVLERESWEGVDTLRPAKFRNNKLDRGLAERYAIKIEIPAVYIKILHLLHVYLLFGRIIGNVSWFFSLRTNGVDRGVWFKECLEQIIRDLTMLEEREETLGRGGVDLLHAFD
jgi:hypothetical protein